MLLAGILLVLSVATLWSAWEKFWIPVAPDLIPLSLAGLSALVINPFCAFVLARYRHQRRRPRIEQRRRCPNRPSATSPLAGGAVAVGQRQAQADEQQESLPPQDAKRCIGKVGALAEFFAALLSW